MGINSRFLNLDTDVTLSSNSDEIIPSQKAIKTYIDTKDSNVVHKTGNETIAGTKTFSNNIIGNLTGTASKATADADNNTISSTYLKLSGGTMTGGLKFGSSAIPQENSPSYMLSMDAFASGGAVKWVSIANVKAGKDADGNTISTTYLKSHQSIKSIKSDNTTAQSTSSSEAVTGSGTINLHKIAKTGTFSDLLSKPTSISGYGITDAYTKTEVDGMISSVYKPAGSVAFASLPTLSSNVLGNVYNVTDAFTTTADFVEGAGKSYPAGTNVVVIEPTSGTYKFDVLAGFVDLSGYVPTSRKVNGKALSADITLTASDVGAQASGNYISYTNNTATVAGTSKTVSKTNPETLFVPNGLIMGGTAAAAGLVTRGICGTTEPTSTGGATKDNLYLNYDGSNTYNASRQVVIQAGTVGTHYGNNLYQYAAARGDAVKNYADATYVPQTRTINSKALSSNITLDASDVGLGNVDNTSDLNKPISTATQTALDGKENTISDLSKIRSGANSFYVKGTQTASTNAFTGVLSAVSELYEGLTIDYWLPYAGTSAGDTLNLTLAGGVETGAINCYYSGTTRLTTHLSANCVGRFIYQTVTISGTNYTGWWLLKAYYTEGSNTYDREYDNYYRAYAGMALPKYGLLMKGVNGRLYSIVATYGTATDKVVTTVGLRPDLIWWNNANATTNAGAVIKAQALYRSMPSTAGSSVFNASVPTYCDIYLCGNYDENTGLFYLSTTDTNGNASVTDYYRFVPYNTEPTYSDYFITGRYYIFVGSSYSTANYYQLMDQHPMYYYDGINLINASDKPKYAATFVDWSE